MALKQYREAARTAIIIAREEQSAGMLVSRGLGLRKPILSAFGSINIVNEKKLKNRPAWLNVTHWPVYTCLPSLQIG